MNANTRILRELGQVCNQGSLGIDQVGKAGLQ